MNNVRYSEERGVKTLGSAGCQPAIVGSLPTTLRPTRLRELWPNDIVLGKLPSTTGWQPVLPRKR